ncbi:MAG TPA: NAD(P)/FAD-dependent oxidoreductase [Mycobacteriales bacterium]|nr:NAD(P)/FAD-dependent oxidoreductase [Mycobacteriales bacterium]
MTTRRRDVVVVGAGHNGLIAACYLAGAGLDVEVLERDRVAGGAVSTVERWPGVRVDRGSSIHVMIRQTDIVDELRLAEVGLQYDDVEPWATLPHAETPLRFAASLDETCESIAAACGPADADAYYRFVSEWRPKVRAFLALGEGPPTAARLGRALWRIGRRPAGGRGELIRASMQPAQQLLEQQFRDPHLRAALGWWAAQAGPPPHALGTAPTAGTLAMFHLRPAGRPRGGSGRLSEALVERLTRSGGRLRTDCAVTAIRPMNDGAEVVTSAGEPIAARAVVAACHAVETARLLGDDAAAGRIRVGHGLGMVVRLLTDALPTYRPDTAGVHTSMQLLVDSTDQLRAAYGDFLRREPPTDPPLVVMTPSATDDSLAPPGRHVVTAWAQWHPVTLATGSWDQRRDEAADAIVATIERWAPGFSGHVLDRVVQAPPDLERELGLVAANVMHVETELDAMFGLRPLPGWSAYRTPAEHVYLCGASTHPGGGVWGVSGRSVARIVHRDLGRRRRFHNTR